MTPVTVLDAVRPVLARLPAHRRTTFELRLERWWPDLSAGVAAVHADALDVATRLAVIAAEGFAARPDELHVLDERRLLEPDRLQRPEQLGYACYTERFGGDLAGVGERLDYLAELGVTYLHLMPLLQPRDGDNDGGYAVADYRRVRPDLGTMDDLAALAGRLRERGMSLVVDLVLNHVAREHPWAVAARAGDERHRAYFHVFPDRTVPDAFERTVPEVFPDFAPGSFTADPDLDGWVWTTFNSWQWDLDWSNPDVLAEFAEIVLLLANAGVEVLRLDAIAFLWKRLGTTCQNEPEVHALTQALRTVARLAAPAVAFKAEAIVGPRDLVAYLGTGEHAGRVSDLAYHNTLMVQVWSMLAARDTRLARHALAALPDTPSTATWITYVRCHDDIGWAIDDADAAAVGLSGPAHRAFLSDWYAGDFPGSWSEGLVFQHNPATGDRRISGTAASLAGLGAGRRDADGAFARLFLAHAIVAAWGGIPVIWSGDELALPNDPYWAAEPGHGADNRWAHRPRVTDVDRAGRLRSGSDAARAFAGLAHLARVRASLPQLHGSVTPQVLLDTDDGLLVLVRRHPSGALVAVYNVTAEARPLSLPRLEHLLPGAPSSVLHDALSGHGVTAGADGIVHVPPYAAWWVVRGPAQVSPDIR
ncbi:alpha-amylase family protein [Nocardioides sp. TRM66260-LWL]|uniref:alpha-amylase family protein n=1 Tax=Nocardioides sp. TRM66260-LWL TaxID=2874478 RepID=UPI001CC5B52E|nr:alpha-amylase family protein [Nocardioides sp. TRM66260-LWL]MBZ5732888.1 alpha-amylase family protein [Nocardioides sp. TRM66260-LWL]